MKLKQFGWVKYAKKAKITTSDIRHKTDRPYASIYKWREGKSIPTLKVAHEFYLDFCRAYKVEMTFIEFWGLSNTKVRKVKKKNV